ncbi:hypothetical protein C2I18_05855 [Paenibacillus sp. PK3_47]|uniref:EpsG family protein n=1 Tax=Paenibacillus sp. PK3_47 TaxID=2072642 RepID=UPI00201DFBE6|nr:EpsG family protein [Paenibacillus sp. PK3_47]UQZ33123.1 hypothetical protein C2I18_05855 [Paenibacillus sp. PK3_47]
MILEAAMILYFFSACIYFLNLITVVFKKKSRLFAILLFVLMFILMTATNNSNGENGDYRAYSNLYNHFLNGGTLANIAGYQTDFGYMTLLYWVSKLNITYNAFLVLISIISFFLIRSTVKKITNNYNAVLVFYTIFPFFYDAIQFRFFFAYSIIVFALRYLLFENNKDYKKYFILVLFASLFHLTALFYFVYFLVFLNFKTLLKALGILSFIITLYLFISNISIVNIINNIISYDKIEQYSVGNIGYDLNPLTSFAIIFFMIFFVFIITYINKKNESHTTNYLLLLNIINLLILPFLLVSLDFERFIRPVLFINYAVISKEVFNLNSRARAVLLFSLLTILFLRFYMMKDSALILLENNYIFSFFVSN